MGSVRRAVQFEVNAAQFDRFGERSIKGFREFNPGWDLVVCDLGLTFAQHELLTAAGCVVRKHDDDKSARLQPYAQFQNLRDLLDTYDTVLRLNIETFTFASIAPWVGEFEKANFDVSANITKVSLRRSIRNLGRTFDALGIDDEDLDRAMLDTAVMLLHRSDKVISILDTILASYDQLVGSARYQESVWLSALLWHHDCDVLIPKAGYIAYPAFTPRHRSYIAASDHPITSAGNEVFILYFHHEKHHFTRIDGWKGLGYRMWVAWCDATKHFLEFPWTT